MINEEEIINSIREEAKRYFTNASPSHDWNHVERVEKLAVKIAEQENANLFIVRASTLLHDIGRKQEGENPKLSHEEISAEYTREILKNYPIGCETTEQIIHCILSHRFRKDFPPETKEAKSLYDADKLDCIGAIGVARTYAFAGEQRQKLYSKKEYLETGYEKDHSPFTEFTYKLIKIKNKMLTATGKAMAEERHKYISGFFARLEKEIIGEL